MIYTSAFYHGTDQTLEQAQENKLNMLCNKVHLKKGDKFLDIGCGWGTLVRHAAQKFGAKARGVTLKDVYALREGAPSISCLPARTDSHFVCPGCVGRHTDVASLGRARRHR